MIVEQVEDEDGSSGIRWKQYGDQRWRSERFSPYFYVDASEEYIAPRGVDARYERNLPYRAYDGTELHKVILETTRDARDARDAADNHYEADIPFERRYYIDRVEGGLVGGGDISDARPNIAHLDIEVWADGGQVDALEADEPVISASVYFERSGRHVDLLLDPPQAETESDPDWAGDDPVLVFDEEAAMLRHLGRVITGEGVEVLCGWNIGGYDIPYLIKRFDEVRGVEPGDLSPLGESYVSTWTTDEGERRIRPTVKGVDLFDMMEAYKHLKRRDKPPNWRLGTVAEYEGTDVRKMDVDASRIGPVWESRPMEVMEYNRADAELTHHIAESVSAFDLFLEMHRAFAIPLSDTLNNSVLVEMYVMSRSEEWGIRDRVLDSKRDTTGGFEGGNTKQPDPGRYEWVFGADVTSEYPNWVRAANLSPETVVTPEDPEWGRGDLIDTPMDGIRFLPHDERLGILPRAVDEMFQMKRDKTELRSEHEYGSEAYQQADLERDATKWFLNSIQGVTGMETHRLSKVEVSAAITAFGRETVERMVEVGESMGYDFVYGDTDSAFFVDRSGGVGCTDDAVGAARRLARETNEDLPEWARERYGIEDDRRHHLEVEPEKVAKRAFFPSKKKRYTLWIVWDDGQDVDKISHTGWAVVRSDTSAVEETAQRNTLEAIMHNRDESFITDRLGEEMHRVVDGEHGPIDMARPQGSSKAFARYGDNRGTEDFENVPYFVAAMMSSNELLGTDYRGGDKTWMLPVRETETVEVNGSANDVNYLAIDEDTDLPDWVEIDYDKVLDNIVGKVRLVYESLGWDLGRLKTHKSDALGKAEVERVQANNHTLGVFSS